LSFDQISNILLAALGISFLIFIHELGHFVAARIFKVRVDTFSIGFGPRIFGFRRGDTDYRLSAIPLGGYVKMAGEYGDYDDNTELDPDDLMAKPPWQRAIVFSGGVLVNFAFAFVIFPIAFAIGVPFTAPVIGAVTPGGAAWSAGILPGDQVVRVNDSRIYGFPDISLEIALGDPSDTEMLILRDGQEFALSLTPTYNVTKGRYEIGIAPTSDTAVVVAEDLPAAAAGLQSGDRIVTINGATMHQVDTPIGLVLDQAMSRGQPLDVRFERDGRMLQATVEPTVSEQAGPSRFGVMPISTLVSGLRGQAASAGFPIRFGDIVESVNGKTVLTYLQLVETTRSLPAGDLTLEVRRDGQLEQVSVPARQRVALEVGDVAFGNHMAGTRIVTIPGSALQTAGLGDGDWLLAVDDKPLSSYTDFQDRVRDVTHQVAIRYRRAADGTTHRVVVQSSPSVLWDYGLSWQFLEVLHQESWAGAVRAGVDTSFNILRTTWVTLTKLFTGEVASKNLGGIVSISVLSYHFANWGFAKLLFFLGMLSINLGFINVLPIPVLDGGQVMFLVFEKIKGSRLSERFMNSMQLAGLVAILALVVYVTYNDIARLVG
jgi:regulator of sigma E protease